MIINFTDFKPSRLPEGYQEVEWVESRGSGNVPTGLTFNDNYTIASDIAVNDYSGTQGFFGPDTSNIAFVDGVPFVATSGFDKPVIGVFNHYEITVAVPNKTRKMNEVTVSYTSAYVGSYVEVPLLKHPNDNLRNAHGKIKTTSVILNGVLTAVMIPCYRILDSKIGFYDIIRNQFLPGNGTLYKGADV